jgi:hypothetical protein
MGCATNKAAKPTTHILQILFILRKHLLSFWDLNPLEASRYLTGCPFRQSARPHHKKTFGMSNHQGFVSDTEQGVTGNIVFF